VLGVRKSRSVTWHLLVIGTLALAVWSWASSHRAQAGTERSDSCPPHWTYELASPSGYLTPLPVSNSHGDLIWAEHDFPSEHTATVDLVATRDGRTRWRRWLSSGARPGPFVVSGSLVTDDLLAVAFESRLEGRRVSDGRVVWSRDLRTDLAPELRRLVSHGPPSCNPASRPPSVARS
jgi:hypothetical protein